MPTNPPSRAALPVFDTLSEMTIGRWGQEHHSVVVSTRKECGTFSDHMERGCVMLGFRHAGMSWAVHLTPEDAEQIALRLTALTAPSPPSGA